MADFVEIKKEHHILLKDYIEAYKKSNLSYDKLFLNEERTIHMTDLFDNFLNDYFKENTEILVLTDEEKESYKYNPVGLSHLMYNSPDMWRVLLKCNNLFHPGELDFSHEFRVPKINKLVEFFSKYNTVMDNLGGKFEDLKDVGYSEIL